MTKTLAELCAPGRSICYGIVQPGRPTEGGKPILRVKDLSGNRIDFSDVMHVEEAIEAKYKRSRIKTGDVLISLVGSLGQVAIAGPEVDGWNIARAVGLIPVADYHHAQWVRFSLQSLESQAFIRDHANTTVQATFNLKDLARLPIPYPPENDRRAILGILGALDDKIELNRRMSATLEELARSLYRSWFVDFDPVHSRAEGRLPAFMDEDTAALFPDRFGNDGLPLGWMRSELGKHCEHVKRTVKPMDDAEGFFQHFSLPAFDASARPVIETGADIKSNKAFVPNNAILFSRLNPYIPRVWWARTDQNEGTPAASTEFFVASALSEGQTPWLYCVMSDADFRDAAKARITGTSNSHQRVKPDALKEISVIWPGDELVEAFGATTNAWFDKIQAMSAENVTLAALRDSLLPKLMSGELRVGEAQEQVDEVA